MSGILTQPASVDAHRHRLGNAQGYVTTPAAAKGFSHSKNAKLILEHAPHCILTEPPCGGQLLHAVMALKERHRRSFGVLATDWRGRTCEYFGTHRARAPSCDSRAVYC